MSEEKMESKQTNPTKLISQESINALNFLMIMQGIYGRKNNANSLILKSMKTCDSPDDWVCAICDKKYNDSYEDPLMPSFDDEGNPVIGRCGHIFHMICMQKQVLAEPMETKCFTCKKEILCSCEKTPYFGGLRYST